MPARTVIKQWEPPPPVYERRAGGTTGPICSRWLIHVARPPPDASSGSMGAALSRSAWRVQVPTDRKQMQYSEAATRPDLRNVKFQAGVWGPLEIS